MTASISKRPGLMMWPRYLIFLRKNSHFLNLRDIPALAMAVSTASTALICSGMDCENIMTSSK